MDDEGKCEGHMHKPKKPGCDTCELVYMQGKPGHKSKEPSEDHSDDYENMNTDLIILNPPDENGCVVVYHTVGTTSKVGFDKGLKNKEPATTHRQSRVSKVWL